MNEDLLLKALEELKFFAYFDGNFKVVGKEGKLKFEIRVKENGHNEPHFHVETSDYNASYSLNTLERIAGVFPVRIEKNIISWANKNINLLKETWNEYHGDFIRVI